MGLEAELTVAIYTGNETRLGSLNTQQVEIKEITEQGRPRELDITHPLIDDYGNNITKYDELLNNGNKIFRPKTCNGDSCLFVIEGPKKPNYLQNEITTTAIEVSSELGEYGFKRTINPQWVVNSTFINSNCGHLYNPGILTGPTDEVNYSGIKSPLEILNYIQDKLDGEFQFRYESVNGIIKRYIDWLPLAGKVHTTAIDLNHNASEINHTSSEVDLRKGAGPKGEPSSSKDDFHSIRAAFEALAITKGQNIPFGITKNDAGTEVPTGYANAPYTKNAGEGWVVCDVENELTGNYYEINGKEKSNNKYPRLWGFDSSETNIHNLYWECVEHIHEHTTPIVKIDCSVSDLKKIQGYDGEYYNTNDIVPVRIPGRRDKVQCRITSTTKDPRKPEEDQITIETYKTSFMRQFFMSAYRSPGTIPS